MSRTPSFSQNHPERQEDEVYCGWVSIKPVREVDVVIDGKITTKSVNENGETDYDKSRFKTKRLGDIPYSQDGKPLFFMVEQGMRPLFVKKSEWDNWDWEYARTKIIV